jgi:hypothetical protein
LFKPGWVQLTWLAGPIERLLAAMFDGLACTKSLKRPFTCRSLQRSSYSAAAESRRGGVNSRERKHEIDRFERRIGTMPRNRRQRRWIHARSDRN